MIFATPDFGAGGAAWGLLCLAWAVVFVLIAFGIVGGIKLLKSESPKVRKYGLLLVLVSGMVPLCCWFLPPHAVYIMYGNYPLGTYPNGKIKEGMEVIGADGVHIGTVYRIEGHRIELTKKDSGEGSHKGHHHYISVGLIADIEGRKVRLSANADVAVTMEEE